MILHSTENYYDKNRKLTANNNNVLFRSDSRKPAPGASACSQRRLSRSTGASAAQAGQLAVKGAVVTLERTLSESDEAIVALGDGQVGETDLCTEDESWLASKDLRSNSGAIHTAEAQAGVVFLSGVYQNSYSKTLQIRMLQRQLIMVAELEILIVVDTVTLGPHSPVTHMTACFNRMHSPSANAARNFFFGATVSANNTVEYSTEVRYNPPKVGKGVQARVAPDRAPSQHNHVLHYLLDGKPGRRATAVVGQTDIKGARQAKLHHTRVTSDLQRGTNRNVYIFAPAATPIKDLHYLDTTASQASPRGHGAFHVVFTMGTKPVVVTLSTLDTHRQNTCTDFYFFHIESL